MKKLFVAIGIAAVCFSVQAQVKCETDSRGNTCCWDVQSLVRLNLFFVK